MYSIRGMQSFGNLKDPWQGRSTLIINMCSFWTTTSKRRSEKLNKLDTNCTKRSMCHSHAKIFFFFFNHENPMTSSFHSKHQQKLTKEVVQVRSGHKILNPYNLFMAPRCRTQP